MSAAFRRFWASTLLLSFAVLLAVPASARKFQMSGTWIARRETLFVPLQFAGVAPKSTLGEPNVWASMGNLTLAFGFPNGPIPGQGGVTATGSAPATLRIPAHRFVEDAMAAVPLNGITLVQIATEVGIDAPYAAATLAPGGGPGSFTWCPGDAACVAMPPPAKRATDPPHGMGGTLFNGRVIYRAGTNRFGGAMQLGLRGGGVVSVVSSRVISGMTPPFRVAHYHFWGSGSTLREDPVGGAGSADVPRTGMRYPKRAFVTQPTMVPAMGSLILHPGPKVTTMGGLTNTGMGNVFYPRGVIAIGPMGTPVSQFTTQYGFAHTTGTVFVQQTKGSGGQDFFSAMGSDARTPLGAGNLSLVAGGLTRPHYSYGPDIYASFHKVKLTLAAPIPSLSPAGAAAGAALVILAAGYVLRRRIG